jgi:hypothetical protein
MNVIRLSRRGFIAAMAAGVAGPLLASGCDSGSGGGAPAPVNQEANTKSLQATGDYYRQQHQQKKK